MGTDINMVVETRDNGGSWGLSDHPGYRNRNYDAFAILANVRNGTGFAGVDTGDGFVPISFPRGLPIDMSGEAKSVDFGYHDMSYVTLRELLDYDWDQTTRHRGYVTAEEFKVYRERGKPDSWCGGVGGSMVRIISNKRMASLIDRGDDTSHRYTQVEWEEKYRESAEDFLSYVEGLKPLGDPDNVRLVFGFDS